MDVRFVDPEAQNVSSHLNPTLLWGPPLPGSLVLVAA